MTCDYPTLNDRAARTTASYGWLPEAKLIKRGIVPEGFRKQVTAAILDFKDRGTFYDWDQEANDDYHVKRLVELRVQLAKIHVADPPDEGVDE